MLSEHSKIQMSIDPFIPLFRFYRDSILKGLGKHELLDRVPNRNILDDSSFNEDQIVAADLNHDGVINVIDVVSLVNTVLIPPQENHDFTLEDINPVSEYYGNDIGPSFFSGQVSCYYFGKQG